MSQQKQRTSFSRLVRLNYNKRTNERKNMAAKEKQPELDGVEGTGVSPLSLPDVNKAINRYEKMKNARCEASPGEIEAKQKLKAVLHANREALPKNEHGVPFYRYEDVDYLLEEKLLRRKVDTGADDDGD